MKKVKKVVKKELTNEQKTAKNNKAILLLAKKNFSGESSEWQSTLVGARKQLIEEGKLLTKN